MEKYFMTQHHAGLLAHNDFPAQARFSSQGKIKKVQIAENISPKNYLKGPYHVPRVLKPVTPSPRSTQ